jgi:hypothetical protein
MADTLDTIDASKLTEITGGLYDSPLAILAIPLLLGGWSRSSSRAQPLPQPLPPTTKPARAPGPPLKILPPAARR